MFLIISIYNAFIVDQPIVTVRVNLLIDFLTKTLYVQQHKLFLFAKLFELLYVIIDF